MKYTLNLISVKETIRKNGKPKKDVQSITLYDSITFDLAKYLAVKAGCKLLFLDKKGEICFQKTAHTAIGYYSKIYTNNIVIALIDPVVINKSGDTMYPEIKNITLNDSVLDWKKFDAFISKHKTKFEDYGIEAYNLWGPSSLIPKGYEHVLSGNIMEGDYYFEKDHWIKASVSFSGLKIGDPIVEYSCVFKGKRPGREENEHIRYYHRYIIRKKGSNKYKTKNTITIIQ